MQISKESKKVLRSKLRDRFKYRLKYKKTPPSVIPNTITLFAFCFGLTGIRMALLQKWDLAVIAILVAAVLDFMDGRIARLLNGTSRFGAELDSFSDLMSFGVSPALILYIKTMYQWEEWGWSFCLFFAVCTAIRLARFNAGNVGVDRPLNTHYHTGVPAPAAGVLGLSPIIWNLAFPSCSLFQSPIITAFVTVGVGTLMISRLPTFSIKQIKIPSSYFVLALIGLFSLGMLFYTCLWLTLTCLGVGYLITIPISVWRMRREAP